MDFARPEWSERSHFPADVFLKLGKLGLMGMLVDEKYGGAGARFVSYVAAMEELGAADQSVASGWNAHSTIASVPLATFGTVEQKQRWLVPLATGTHIGAFGLTDGSNAAGIRTQARQADSSWILNDTKMCLSATQAPK